MNGRTHQNYVYGHLSVIYVCHPSFDPIIVFYSHNKRLFCLGVEYGLLLVYIIFSPTSERHRFTLPGEIFTVLVQLTRQFDDSPRNEVTRNIRGNFKRL